jgi:lipopolysaccharide/colanic/teichoic acid biosynthesis glycosyltransferase
MLVKRSLDLIASACALALLAPVLLVLAIGVRIDSSGPALFRHRRVGRHGREFDVLKFRTMEHRLAVSGPQVTAANDVRITRIGRFLRRTKLDELPQLVNIRRGEMILVGPRPEVARYVALYPVETRAEILAVRPGMTDLASIQFRDEQELLAAAPDPEWTYVHEILPRKLELYRQYVRGQNLFLDLKIIFRTVSVLVFRRTLE